MIANLLGALSVRRVPCLRATPGPGPRRLLLLPPQLRRSGGYSSSYSSSYRSSYSSYSSSYSSNADESCSKGSYSSSKSCSSRGNASDNSGRYNSSSSSSNNSSSNSSGSRYDNGSCDINNSSRCSSSSSSRFGGGGGTDISSSNSCSRGSGSDGRSSSIISSSSSSNSSIISSSSSISSSVSSRRSGVRKPSGGSSLARQVGAAESPSAPKQEESLCRRQLLSSMAANQSKIDWNSWEKAKDQLAKLKDIDERRKYYKCSSNYITLKSLDKWSEKDLHSQDLHSQDKLTELEKPGGREYEVNHQINDKVSLFKGDITLLEIDAIVNAANSTLLGGGGVDGCIHRSAGSLLKEECRSLGGCSTGKAKITCGYRLPSKYVIHTVGPRVMDSVPTPEERKQLDGCYSECLHIVEDKELRSVAFPCISTGIYGFPNEPAARIALETTRNWLEKYHSKVDRIIFCLFLPIDVELYDTLMPIYFPRAPKESSEGVADGPAVAGTENENDDKDRDPKDVEEDEAKDEDMPSQDTDSDPTKTSD